MLAMLAITNVLLIFMNLCIVLKKVNWVKTFALSFSVFFCNYAVISGIFFLLDSFNFHYVLVTQLVLEIVLAIISIKKWGATGIEFEFSVRVDLLPIILMVIILPFTYEKFELFGTGQDQGLYQAEALALIKGNYEVQHDFEEYQILQAEEDKEEYRSMVYDVFIGFLPLASQDLPTVEKSEIISDVSGVYHGVQTFPAILALWGKLFGMENMIDVQTLFFLCSVIILYYAIHALNINNLIKTACVLMYGFSPLVLWTSKSSFTEMVLTLIILTYIMFLVDKNQQCKWMMAIPIVSFAFIHVSFLTILPIFVLVNLWSYVRDDNKQYLWVNMASAVGLACGYCMMSEIAAQYFYFNCSRLYVGNVITADNFMYWIYAIAFAIIVISLFVIRWQKQVKIFLESKIIKILIRVFIVLSGIFMIYYGYKMGYQLTPESSARPDVFQYYGSGMLAFKNLTLYAFCMSTGFVIVPLIIYHILKSPEDLFEKTTVLMLGILFLYTVIFQAVVLRREVAHYYYYCRYLTFYIPIICCLGAVFFTKYRKGVILIITTVTLVIMLRYDAFVVAEKDATQIEWETILDLNDIIKDDSAIIISEKLQRDYAVYIRTLSGEAIFPMFDDVDRQISMLKQNFENVYCLTDYSSIEKMKFDSKYFELVYRDINHRSFYGANLYTFPTSAEKRNEELLLYLYYQDGSPECIFDISDDSIGVSKSYKTKNCIVSTGEQGTVAFGPNCTLPEGKYLLKTRIENINSPSKDVGSVKIYVDQGNDIVPETNFSQYLVDEGEKTYLEIPFELTEKQENLEFLFTATQGSVYRLYSYELYKQD